MKILLKILLIPFLFIAIQLEAQQRLTISGTIHDAQSGENLIGASVYVKELATGTQANVYGFYSLSILPGVYNLEFRCLGHETITKLIELNSNANLNIELNPENQVLNEVVIESTRAGENISNTVMSVNRLDIKTIQKLPAFLGEADVIKSILLLPGVSTVGEGASGFNVRGGSVGQNLILLDEAPVYNSSHLLGFFSIFNPDAVKDVKLYKGGIPAQYGGRIASILDIRMKEGNNKRIEVNGGIGSIFSRITFEAPIIKDKSSFIIAARRSYADVLFRPFVEVLQNGAGLNFHDLTLKTNFDFGKKDKIFLSGYLGRDVFKFDKNQGFSWGNKTGTVRWNHLFTQHLFMNLTSYLSDYDYNLEFGENDQDRFEWKSRIQAVTIKPSLSFFYGMNNVLNFGGEALYYHFYPATAIGISNGQRTDISLDNKYALESSIYLSNEQNINNTWAIDYGLRLTDFKYLGPGTVYEYQTVIPGKRKIVTGVSTAERFETIQNYINLEPRASVKFQINKSTSVKASYNRLSQYVHLISNTTASNPLDIWTPSTNNIMPETGDQYAAGLFKNFANNSIELSVEGYYKDTKNQIDYIDGADLLINQFLEGELLNGIGRAYGLEIFAQKKSGKFNGWLSYTIGHSELKVNGINNFNWYPARYDQLHNLKIALFYDLNPRWTFSTNFTFLSGTPTTFPTSRFQIQDYLIPYNGLNSRNNVRIPNYHRLDLSATLYGKKINHKGKERKNQDFWVFSVYNVYARRNPFSIYFAQSSERPVTGEPIETMATRVSIIGTIIPAVSYNFKF